MLIRLFPESQETPTILFSLEPPSPKSNIPLPSYYNSQLETLGSYGLPPPRSVYSLDKAGWALALLEEVVFDLAMSKVGVKWVDGGINEWEMDECAFEVCENGRAGLKRMLLDVVRGVQESELRREDEKREELVASLLQSIPQSFPQTAPISRPSSRSLRRQARSTLLDAFRLHVVHHLSSHHHHRSSYPLWIARRCLEALMVELGHANANANENGEDFGDEEESLGSDETFEDSMDMDMDENHTPNTSVTSIVPCSEDPESPLSSEPTSPVGENDCEACRYRDVDHQSMAEVEDDECGDKENADSGAFANNNPYPSFPPPSAILSRTRLPLSETDSDADTVIGENPSLASSPPPVQLSVSVTEAFTNPHPSFIKTVHLHALISHLEYEEDRQRAYLDPETNPDFANRWQSGSAPGAKYRVRKESGLRFSYTAEDLQLEVEDDFEDVETEEEAEDETTDVEPQVSGDNFEVDQITELGPSPEPIFAYESSEEGSDCVGEIPDDETAVEDNLEDHAQQDPETEAETEVEIESEDLFLPTPPTSSDDEYRAPPLSTLGIRKQAPGGCQGKKRAYNVKRKPSPSLHSVAQSRIETNGDSSPERERKRAFLGTIPLPGDEEGELWGYQFDGKDDDSGGVIERELGRTNGDEVVPPFEPTTVNSLGFTLDSSKLKEVPVMSPVVGMLIELDDDSTRGDEALEARTEPGPRSLSRRDSQETCSTLVDEPILDERNEDDTYGEKDDTDMTVHDDDTYDIDEEEASLAYDDSDPDSGSSKEPIIEAGHVVSKNDSGDDYKGSTGIDVSIEADRGVKSILYDSGMKFEMANVKHYSTITDTQDVGAKSILVAQSTSGFAKVVEPYAEASPIEIDANIKEVETRTAVEVIREGCAGTQIVSDVHSTLMLNGNHNSVVHEEHCGPSLEQASDTGPPPTTAGKTGVFLEQVPMDPGPCSKVLSIETPDEQIQDTPKADSQSRPPSPSPFISPRSLGITPTGTQYDFEWGRYSPLARAVVLRNWNNPMDSDSDPDEMY